MLGDNKSKKNEHHLDFSAEHPAELAEICSADHAHHSIKNDVAKVETPLPIMSILDNEFCLSCKSEVTQ